MNIRVLEMWAAWMAPVPARAAAGVATAMTILQYFCSLQRTSVDRNSRKLYYCHNYGERDCCHFRSIRDTRPAFGCEAGAVCRCHHRQIHHFRCSSTASSAQRSHHHRLCCQAKYGLSSFFSELPITLPILLLVRSLEPLHLIRE